MRLQRKINQSLKHLQNAAKKSNPLIVNFSGGKDSLAYLLLALDATENVECFFMNSGQELPGTEDYVRKRCHEFGVTLNISHPAKDRIQHKPGGIPQFVCLLPDYIRWWRYWPTEVRRYCATWLKHRPCRVYCRKKWGLETLFKVVGIRTDESSVRKWKYGSRWAAKKYRGKYVRPDSEHSGSFLVFPILDWTREDVIDFLEARGVEIHEGYKLFGMSGCKWCPVAKPEQIYAVGQKYPEIYQELLEVEAELEAPAWKHKRLWLKNVLEGNFTPC